MKKFTCIIARCISVLNLMSFILIAMTMIYSGFTYFYAWQAFVSASLSILFWLVGDSIEGDETNWLYLVGIFVLLIANLVIK